MSVVFPKCEPPGATSEAKQGKRTTMVTGERPRTARQYVLGILRTEILQGRHPPGSRLRQEEVAGRLNVSTTPVREAFRSEEHTSELQSLMRISYAVFCLKKKN